METCACLPGQPPIKMIWSPQSRSLSRGYLTTIQVGYCLVMRNKYQVRKQCVCFAEGKVCARFWQFIPFRDSCDARITDQPWLLVGATKIEHRLQRQWRMTDKQYPRQEGLLEPHQRSMFSDIVVVMPFRNSCDVRTTDRPWPLVGATNIEHRLQHTKTVFCVKMPWKCRLPNI
jgi:hypothetical protein